jgi:hypothetical protein
MDSEENRLFLHSLLETTFPDVTIYYRPPGNILLEYPCIVYERKAFEPTFANTAAYIVGTRFQLSFLSQLPGYSSVQSLYALHGQGLIVTSSDSYENDDIVHDVFSISVNSL